MSIIYNYIYSIYLSFYETFARHLHISPDSNRQIIKNMAFLKYILENRSIFQCHSEITSLKIHFIKKPVQHHFNKINKSSTSLLHCTKNETSH